MGNGRSMIRNEITVEVIREVFEERPQTSVGTTFTVRTKSFLQFLSTYP